MSADIVNLRQARKAKARAEQQRMAGENRALHGRSKTTRRHEAAKKLLDERRLDGSLRQPPIPDDDP